MIMLFNQVKQQLTLDMNHILPQAHFHSKYTIQWEIEYTHLQLTQWWAVTRE